MTQSDNFSQIGKIADFFGNKMRNTTKKGCGKSQKWRRRGKG
jgi:hypothetical protein